MAPKNCIITTHSALNDQHGDVDDKLIDNLLNCSIYNDNDFIFGGVFFLRRKRNVSGMETKIDSK